MPIVFADGTLPGSGDVSASAFLTVFAEGELEGSGDITADPGLILLASMAITGSGTITDLLTVTAGGTLDGSGDVDVNQVVRIRPISGTLSGSGTIADIAFLPLHGEGTIVAFFDLIHVPPPICPCGATSAPCPCGKIGPGGLKAFRYGWTYQYPDLSLNLCSRTGVSQEPYQISYALYWVRPNGFKQLVGPSSRTPATRGVGTYYVTGTAGECGQPGKWCVVWSWKQTCQSPVQCREECFWVQDQVLASGCNLSPRVIRYGWDC